MTCERITLPDGTTAIVCSRGKRRARCGWCSEPHTLLCDHPTGAGGKTCSKRMCAAHARQVDGLDLCPAHVPREEQPEPPRIVAPPGRLLVLTSSRWVRDPDRFDISRGGGGEAAVPFAPSKALLTPTLEARSRAKVATDPEEAAQIETELWAWYAPRYRAEMQISHGAVYRLRAWADLDDLQREAWANGVRPHPEAWAAELAKPRRVYQCWCSLDARMPATELLARGHCHRVLLAGFMTACGAVYGGEIATSRARAA